MLSTAARRAAPPPPAPPRPPEALARPAVAPASLVGRAGPLSRAALDHVRWCEAAGLDPGEVLEVYGHAWDGPGVPDWDDVQGVLRVVLAGLRGDDA